MNLSNTGGAGRGSDKGSIVGDVILHGKKKYWSSGGSYHYHHGMQKGMNTLGKLSQSLLFFFSLIMFWSCHMICDTDTVLRCAVLEC
jgi:hypothetical protein